MLGALKLLTERRRHLRLCTCSRALMLSTQEGQAMKLRAQL